MTIEINENGSEAFYKETVNAAAQYAYILKNHGYPLKDYFKQYKNLLIISGIFIVILAVMGTLWGMDSFMIVALALLLIASLLAGAYLLRLTKMVKGMMAGKHRSVLTLDESGVELNVAETQTVKIAKQNLAVVRLFKECLCFIPAKGAGVVISVDKKYADQILGWIRENWPDAEVI